MPRTSHNVQVGKRKLELSNLEKVLFPEDQITKAQLIEYYLTIAPTILTHLKGRPLSVVRFPDGLGGEKFFQKEKPKFSPDWIDSIVLGGEEKDYVLATEEATLAFLAPLLGLLGTVSGMIEAFGTIASHGGYATVTELSGGIYKSLLTTAAGLVVAAPTFVAYSYLSSRVNTMLHEMERAGIEIVHMLKDSEALTGIISFQQSAETAPSSREAHRDH